MNSHTYSNPTTAWSSGTSLVCTRPHWTGREVGCAATAGVWSGDRDNGSALNPARRGPNGFEEASIAHRSLPRVCKESTRRIYGGIQRTPGAEGVLLWLDRRSPTPNEHRGVRGIAIQTMGNANLG